MFDQNLGDAVATLLGYSILIGSCTVKLPIIKNVIDCRGGGGKCLSLSSIYLETLAILASSVYYYRTSSPLSTYGELLSVLVQNIVIIGLMWCYAKESLSSACLNSAVGVAIATIMLKFHDDWLWTLAVGSTFVSMAGQVPQMWENHRNGHTGALSIITQGLNVLGCLVRIFTTLQLIDDLLSLVKCCITAVLHVILFGQILVMAPATARIMKENTKKIE